MSCVGFVLNTRSYFRVCSVLSLVCLFGCGGGEGNFGTAKVTGTVKANGQAVTGGELIFAPVAEAGQKDAGKNGAASIGVDGSFTVSTYDIGDGAVVGKHTLAFIPPAPSASVEGPDGSQHAGAPSAFDGMVPSPAEVTIKQGDNKLDIELVAGPAAKTGN